MATLSLAYNPPTLWEQRSLDCSLKPYQPYWVLYPHIPPGALNVVCILIKVLEKGYEQQL